MLMCLQACNSGSVCLPCSLEVIQLPGAVQGLERAHWGEALAAVKAGLEGVKGDEIRAVAGKLADAESILALKVSCDQQASGNQQPFRPCSDLIYHQLFLWAPGCWALGRGGHISFSAKNIAAACTICNAALEDYSPAACSPDAASSSCMAQQL